MMKQSRFFSQFFLSIRKYLVLAAVIFLCSGCTYKILFWERNIWTEFDGIFVIEEPDNLEKYASLLPDSLDMPQQPLVGMFCADYYDTERWPITLTKYLGPYLESALFITCEYNGQEGWYCPYMAVTTEAALIGGHRLGYPKILADQIQLDKHEKGWNGSTLVDGVEHLGLQFALYPLDSLQQYSTDQVDFMKGNEVSDLKFSTILLRPPAVGPEVVVFSMTPPPLVKRLPGLVSIQLGGPLEGLIGPGTLSPGLYQHFSMGSGQVPSGPVIALVLLVLLVTLSVIILVLIVRRLKQRQVEERML
jgi:hypothetical protein